MGGLWAWRKLGVGEPGDRGLGMEDLGDDVKAKFPLNLCTKPLCSPAMTWTVSCVLRDSWACQELPFECQTFSGGSQRYGCTCTQESPMKNCFNTSPTCCPAYHLQAYFNWPLTLFQILVRCSATLVCMKCNAVQALPLLTLGWHTSAFSISISIEHVKLVQFVLHLQNYNPTVMIDGLCSSCYQGNGRWRTEVHCKCWPCKWTVENLKYSTNGPFYSLSFSLSDAKRLTHLSRQGQYSN